MIMTVATRSSLIYICLMFLPFLATFALDMQDKTLYASFLVLFNSLAMAAFFLQFPLAGRLKHMRPFSNIDWSMLSHRKLGRWLAVIFLLHPILIVAPRFAISVDDGIESLWVILQAKSMLTGILAWLLLMLWVLFSIYRDKLKLSYEQWRCTHLSGFVVIAILATLHVTTVGSHGQFEAWFNRWWWALLALSIGVVAYKHLLQPLISKNAPFTLVSVEAVSSCDWQVTIEKPPGIDFDFEPGQFVWLNTDAAGGFGDHPFSIASSRESLPKLSFLVRSLGDYTSSLHKLTPGQCVYVNGPYGSISLADAKHARAILLLAGGAGIGPMLGLLRGLAEQRDPRPVRLVYGNARLDQMVLQDEFAALQRDMPDFRQQLVCLEAPQRDDIYQGVIDGTIIEQTITGQDPTDWVVYLCGPPPMVESAKASLRKIGVPNANIHYEQLSF